MANEQGEAVNGQSTRATRESVIADLARMAEGTETDAPKAEEPAPEAAKESEQGDREEPEPEDGQAEDEKPEAEEGKGDPDLQKRLAIVAKHEKRAKEREAKAKAEIEAERAAVRKERSEIDREIQAARAEIEAFKQARERAKYDPAGVLRALGLSEDDLGPAARQLWAHSKEQSADPKNREAAARLMKEREAEDRISKLERELAEERKAREAEKSRAQTESRVNEYLTGITKAVSAEDHPLAARAVEKSPERARMRFAAIAHELSERDGDLPDADDVLAEYEKRRRAELEEDGVDVAAMLKRKPAAKRDESRTLGADVGSQTAPKASNGVKKSHAEKRAELEAELRAMDLRSR